MRVCFVGDDVHPPWNHASSILTKRLIEAVSPRAECFLATVDSPRMQDKFYRGVKMTAAVTPSNARALTTIRLSVSAKTASPDIIHLIGVNALIFAPFSKLLGTGASIIRHIFTSYDRNDLAVRPIRSLANALFIDSYAFTTPRIGQWAQEHFHKARRFLIRPPIDCDLYRPSQGRSLGPISNRRERTILYMGPLWGSRFPAVDVLKALKLIINRGLNCHLLVLTSALRSSTMESERLTAIGRSLGLEGRLTVRRVDLSEDERITAYNEADVVIFPYVGPVPERLADPPFGLLEAMACGRLVLATDVLSISEVLKDEETGFVTKDSSPEQIADGLYRSLTTRDQSRIEGNARQLMLREYSYPQVREQLIGSYTSILH